MACQLSLTIALDSSCKGRVNQGEDALHPRPEVNSYLFDFEESLPPLVNSS